MAWLANEIREIFCISGTTDILLHPEAYIAVVAELKLVSLFFSTLHCLFVCLFVCFRR